MPTKLKLNLNSKYLKKRPTFKKKKMGVTKKFVQRIAKKVLTKNTETKIVTHAFSIQPACMQPSTTDITGNWQCVSPSGLVQGYGIDRGTANDQMIGNKVRTKRCSLRFNLQPMVYNADTNPSPQPMVIRAYLFRDKQSPTVSLQPSNFVGLNANFFEFGNDYTGFDGTLSDYTYKIQRDRYIYLGHKTWKLGRAIPANGAGDPQYGQSNNDYKLTHVVNWDITKHLQKVFIQDDTDKWTTPYTFVIFQVIGGSAVTYPPTPAFTPHIAGDPEPAYGKPFLVEGFIQYEYQDV